MLNEKRNKTEISRFLSLVLRHRPETIGIELNHAGWTSIDDLVLKMNDHGMTIDHELLLEIVRTSDKKRFALDGSGKRIRANQGHSIPVQHGFKPLKPPMTLYHGTATKHMKGIQSKGLQKMQRHHVHLSSDTDTALMVGKRHGRPILFEIDANRMHEDGFEFYQSDNGVWLVDQVPAIYLSVVK